MSGSMELNDIILFLNYIKRKKQLDLSFYRKRFVLRRLQARFYATNVTNLLEYITLLNQNEQEWTHFLDGLGINVSEFFRDPEVFATFQTVCIPEFLKKHPGKSIHCWSCGCSYGEEAYSMAIMFSEFLKLQNVACRVHILASDIDETALARAKQGEYECCSIKNVSGTILNQYFIQLNPEKYKINPEIRRMVVFKKLNILQDPPPVKIDVLFFRNVRIYFSEERVEEVMYRIINALNKGGYLVMGKVEHLPSRLSKLFVPIDLVNRIYIKI